MIIQFSNPFALQWNCHSTKDGEFLWGIWGADKILCSFSRYMAFGSWLEYKISSVYSVDAQNWRRFRWNDKARLVNVRLKLYLPMCNTCDAQNEKSHFGQPPNIYKIHVIMYRYYVTYNNIIYWWHGWVLLYILRDRFLKGTPRSTYCTFL